MAPSAILERIRKLERTGVILGYETRVDAEALDLGLTAFTFVRCDERPGERRIGEELATIEQVQEVHYCAGQDSYLVKARVRDAAGMAELLQHVGGVEGTRDTNTIIVLSTLKETSIIPTSATGEGGNSR
jgi:Lrp/AsnC family leucine-responsive transcriptional regulator